jgi:hypothetical protein
MRAGAGGGKPNGGGKAKTESFFDVEILDTSTMLRHLPTPSSFSVMERCVPARGMGG